jgi:hypothetical protein
MSTTSNALSGKIVCSSSAGNWLIHLLKKEKHIESWQTLNGIENTNQSMQTLLIEKQTHDMFAARSIPPISMTKRVDKDSPAY